MEKPEDDKYWNTSATRGFDFSSEETSQDNYNQIFGVTKLQTAELSKQVQEHVPGISKSNLKRSEAKLSLSLSSLSTSSTSSQQTQRLEPVQQFEVTKKLLCSTLNVMVESVLTPHQIIRSIFLGMPYDLSPLKKINDKKALLDEAIKIGDGDVLCIVLLHLQKNLHKSVLYSLLKERQYAAKQYLSILEDQLAFKEAAVLCIELQKFKEAVFHLYNFCCSQDVKCHLKSLQSIQKNELKNMNDVSFEKEILNEHILLLERQIPLASELSKLSQKEKEKSVMRSPLIGESIKTSNIVGSSLLETLQYCCEYFWGSSENLLASPVGIKKLFSVAEKQFIWNAFIGRLLSGNDPIPIVLTKGMLGTAKVSAGLSIPRLLEVAHKLGCQPAFFDQVLPLIESPGERYSLAKRYSRHKIAIDVLANNKDRIALLSYRDLLSDQVDLDYVNNILRVSSTRWKN